MVLRKISVRGPWTSPTLPGPGQMDGRGSSGSRRFPPKNSAKRISFPARVNNGLAGISDTLGFAFLCKLPPARTDFPYRALYATRLLNILLTPPRTSMLPASSPLVNREAASRTLDRGMRYSSQGGPTKNEMAACKGLVATRIWGGES
ncbi:hypothetical protein CIHG_04641 [Coccidioides immitis H538.4]|uniref:Uncharacterized protein n=2 Tax=Coccidioides immitis TaxID=5501 RepID=A0A0J8RPU8_COCIT|nr:hypothetical protein CIRG_06808 [Coccidioides immitis RMSCC 2394]KMU86852.1 hypothetical protein CIHG_04641 [Coccidioides immitis H538.4]